MEAKHTTDKHGQTRTRLQRKSAPDRIEMLGRFIRAVVGGIIGLVLTGLFAGVIIAVVVIAIVGDQSRAAQLLSTALTLVGSALGTVLGYFLGRGADTKSR